jgi:hypothetical protein
MRRGALIAPVASLVACGSQASAVPDRFSGTWKLTDGRTIPIRRVAHGEGAAALRALRGSPCKTPAVYYRSTYFNGVAHMAGCATGDGQVMRGRFNDRGITGSLFMRWQNSKRFAAIVHGDGHAPFTVVAVRIRP